MEDENLERFWLISVLHREIEHAQQPMCYQTYDINSSSRVNYECNCLTFVKASHRSLVLALS